MTNLQQINKNVFSYLSQRKTIYTGDIYHYTSPQGLKGIIEDGAIWFSDMRFLNDTSELTYIYKIASSLLIHIVINPELSKIIQEICYAAYHICNDSDISYILSIPYDKYYLASFSKDPDNLSLWNYYTKSQNSVGYNICIDTNNSLDIGNNQRIVRGEVIYDTEEQLDLLKKCFESYNQYMNENDSIENRVSLKQSIMNTLQLYNLFFKPSAYAMEKEYRFVIRNNKNRKLKYRINDGIFIPYIPIKIKNDSIKSVCVSPSKEQELAKQGVEDFIIQSDKFMTADIKKSAIPKRY